MHAAARGRQHRRQVIFISGSAMRGGGFGPCRRDWQGSGKREVAELPSEGSGKKSGWGR